MASNDPPRRKSWKDAATPASSSKPGSPKGWHHATPADAKAAAGGARKTWIAVIVSAILIVAGAFIWFVLLPRNPPPVRMVLIGAGYETNLAVPQNVAGSNVLDALEGWAKDYNAGRQKGQQFDVRRHVLEGRKADGSETLERALEDCKSEVVIVYLAAHGGADGKGVYFYRQDADDLRTDKDSSVYWLDDVLRALGGLPDKTKKLLILDTAQVGVHWASGQLHNDIARGLEKYEGKIKEVPNLVVMTSCSSGELSWAAPEFQRTIFGHYFLQGLRGGVDQKGRVNALGLHSYVAEKVKRWTLKNRNEEQTPKLFGGDELAGKIELGIAGSSGEEKVPDPETLNLSGVEDVWKQAAQFRNAIPSPAVFSPLAWRTYLDSAIRYEELVRAGDRESAATMQQRLAVLANRIKDDRDIAFRGKLSTQLTLSMPAALGVSSSSKELDAVAKFRIPWDLKEAAEFDQDVDKAVKALLLSAGVGDDKLRKRIVLHEATRKILSDLQEDATRLAPACRALAVIAKEPEVVVRPAESQFAAMMYPEIRDKGECRVQALLDKKQTDLITKAIRVRMLAEQAALGLGAELPAEKTSLPALSEYIRAQLFKDIEAADADRRRGENLLFTTDGSRWAAAGASLDAAEKGSGAEPKGYVEVQKRAVELRRAIKTYHGMLVELPYYSRWTGIDTDRMVVLWAAVHDLGRQLEKPGRMEALRAAREDCEKGLREAQEDLSAAETRKYTDTQGDWHALEDLLRVPFLDPERRRGLLVDSQRISHRLHTEAAAASAAPGAKPTDADRKKAAVSQGKRLLALLGKKPDDVVDTAVKSVRNAEVAESNWRDILRPAEEEIRRNWQERPEFAQALVTRAANEKLEPALVTLHQAAAAARWLDGAGASSQRLQSDPVFQERALLLLDLLAWQADRTFKDFWGNEKEVDDEDKSYYAVAATYFLDEARSHAGEKADEARFSPIAELRKKLKQQPHRELVLQLQSGKTKEGNPIFKPSTAPLNLTDEAEVERIFVLSASEVVPPGEPVMWVVPGDALEVKPDLERKTREAFNKAFTMPLVPKPPRGTQPVVRTSHDVYGLYRGHVVKSTTSVALYREPDISIMQPLFESSGRVAVQNTGAAAGRTSLAFVIDLSGSMKFGPDEKESRNPQEWRWRKVRRAFEEVVRKLPPEITISLRSFQDKSSQLVWKPDRAEKYQKQLQSTLDALEAKLEGGTPLLRAIKDAIDKDFQGFDGLKGIVVLTDGVDNTFMSKDEEALRNNLKADSIREGVKKLFEESDIGLRVVGVDVTKLTGDDKKALQEFQQAVDDVGGSYLLAEKAEEVIEKLDEAVRRMRFTVQPNKGETLPPGQKRGPYDVSRSDQTKQEVWSVAIVTIENSVQLTFFIQALANKAFQQLVRLVPGDALFMEIIQDGNRLALKRVLYTAWLKQWNRNLEGTQRRQRPGDSDWIFSVVDKRREGQDLELMTVIEKDQVVPRDLQNDPTHQVHPRFVWFEIKAPDVETPPRLEVVSRPFYPAPLWTLRAPRWDLVKEPQEPVLQAWWVESGDVLTAAKQLPRGEKYDQLRNVPLAFTSSTGAEIKLNIETVNLASRDFDSGGEMLKNVRCLVVRMTYPAGAEPYFVSIPNKRCGEWHRFYKEANKYVGVFWGTAFDADGPPALDFYSVGELKAKGLSIPATKLARPTIITDQRPRHYTVP